MNTLKFEYNGTEYDVPVKWQTYEWWMQFFELKEAKKAQRAFRQFCINLEMEQDLDRNLDFHA
jgi:hypothetical protein